MKFLRFFPLLALTLILIPSCASDPAPPAPLIERNPEVRKYFDVLSELVDEYCILVEETIDKAEELDKKQEEGDVGFLDGLDMLSGAATSLIKIKNLTDEIESMEEQKNEFEKNLSAEDFKEFLALYTKTLARFYDLAKRAEKLEN